MTKLALNADRYKCEGNVEGFRDGFVVYSGSRIVRIVHDRKYHDDSAKKEFKVFETQLRDGDASIGDYVPLETMWIRFPRQMARSEESHIELTHADLGIVHPDEADWTSVVRSKGYEDNFSTIQEMDVPKSVHEMRFRVSTL